MKPYYLFCCLLLLASYTRAQAVIDTSAAITKNSNLYSLIVDQNDRIIYQRYFNGHTEADLMNDQSLTKSIVSLLIGIAIDKGYISSVDEKIVSFFPELKRDTDQRMQEVTIREIMCQASGLYHEDLTQIGAFLSLPNQYDMVLKSPLVSEPGKVFHYNNAASHLLSVILTRATGMDTYTFAKKYLFSPMGITSLQWAKMNDGYYDGSGLLSIRLRSADMMTIGTLFLHHGRYHNRQIVPSKWIDLVLHPDQFYATDWGFHPSTYALCYYHTIFRGIDITYGMGWGGQFLIIIPSLNTIVVANENTADATAVQQSINFTDRIFPLLFNDLARK